jgi:hypothetical protein
MCVFFLLVWTFLALKDVQAKRFSRFVKDAVLAISRPIKAIRRLKEYIAADSSTEIAQRARVEPDLFVAFEETISKAVQGLVTLVVDTWPANQVHIYICQHFKTCLKSNKFLFVVLYIKMIYPLHHFTFVGIHVEAEPTTGERTQQSTLPPGVLDLDGSGSVGRNGEHGRSLDIF